MTAKTPKTILPEINSLYSTKANFFNKDLFTKKLGHNIRIDFNITQKNYTILKRPKFFQNIKTIPKNKTNNFLSFKKEEDLRKIWEPYKKMLFFRREKSPQFENNKQLANLLLDSSTKSIKRKKEIKIWFNNKEKNIRPKKIIFDSNSGFKKSNYSIENSLKNEKSKEKLELKKITLNKKFSLQNIKIRNKSENFGTVIERISKEEKKSKIFISSFFENLIDIYNSYELYNKIIPLITQFNELFFFLFEIESFPINPLNIKFLDIYKFSAILNISLIFLVKDINLYKQNILKMKDLLEKFLFVSINSFNYKKLESIQINSFCNKIIAIKETLTLANILNEIVDLLFGDEAGEYKKILNCLKQLINNINSQTPPQILSLVNESILFCHNSGFSHKKKKKESKKKTDLSPKISKDSNTNIDTPFIKNQMSKKFCLVLDLDETLIHNLNLSFGEYFLVRPGTFDLMETVHDLYEIIIFTAAKKEYAYNIIEKIDFNNYIDYILYKKHVLNIEGSLVKKLDLIGRDLNKIIYVDNLERNAKFNKKNLYLISSWYNDILDREIYILKDKLINIATCGKFDDDITQGLIEK